MQNQQSSHPQHHRNSHAVHPLIFRILLGFLVAWAAITAAFFVDGQGYGGLIAGVVAVFTLIVGLIPSRLSAIERHHPMSKCGDLEEHNVRNMHEWLDGEVETYSGRERGSDALFEIMLPGMAVIVSGALCALIFHFVAH